MANVAALYLLNRNGAFKGLFSFDSSEGSVVRPDRYHKANINDEVLESYLAGSCKIKVSGMSDISNVFGQVARTNFKKLPDYKQYAQKQLEMIEPPSFLEKMIRRKNDFGFVFLLFCKKECTDFLKNQELELTIRALY